MNESILKLHLLLSKPTGTLISEVYLQSLAWLIDRWMSVKDTTAMLELVLHKYPLQKGKLSEKNKFPCLDLSQRG